MTSHPVDIGDYQATRALAQRMPTPLLWCLHRLRRRGGRPGEPDARLGALARELEARGRRRNAAPELRGLP